MNYNKCKKIDLVETLKKRDEELEFFKLQTTEWNRKYLDEKENARIFKDKLRLKDEAAQLYLKKSWIERVKIAINKENIFNAFLF